MFLQISESQCGRAIRTKKWKYSVRAPDTKGWVTSPDSHIYEEHFLYDLEADHHQQTNLVKNPSFITVRQELATTLKLRMAQAGETIPEIQ